MNVFKFVIVIILICQLLMAYFTWDSWRMDKKFYEKSQIDTKYDDTPTQMGV